MTLIAAVPRNTAGVPVGSSFPSSPFFWPGRQGYRQEAVDLLQWPRKGVMMGKRKVEQVEFVGGPIAGRRPRMAGMSDVMAIPVDAELTPSPQEKPFAVALYRQRKDEGGVSYHFVCFERFDKEPFEVEYADGPNQGVHASPQPADFNTKEVLVPLTDDGSVFQGAGQPAAVAVYRSKLSDGKWRFHLDRIEESGKLVEKARARVHEHRAMQALYKSYRAVDGSVENEPATGEHPQTFIEHGHRKAYVDEQIAPLIQAIWERGLETLGSCQELPSGKAQIEFPVARQGEVFHKRLVEEGIDAECEGETLAIQDPDSGEAIQSDGARVRFSVEDIGRVVALISPSAAGSDA